MGAAQETYKAMLRDQIAPGLRSLGMRGSNGSFTLPDPTHHLLVGFQASHHSTSEKVSLAINLAAIDGAAWEARRQGWWGRPSANTQTPIGVYERLGSLLPGVHGDWWEVASGVDTAALAERLCAAVGQYGLPWLLAARALPQTSTPWPELNQIARGGTPS